jgi:hypothetical protein
MDPLRGGMLNLTKSISFERYLNKSIGRSDPGGTVVHRWLPRAVLVANYRLGFRLIEIQHCPLVS